MTIQRVVTVLKLLVAVLASLLVVFLLEGGRAPLLAALWLLNY